ncbi:MAG: Phenylacetate-coenzyme A ligase [Bacteroidia bacterium]|nr:Phenylacetate-coenzyme A ligase [Bacteroidia bacterium]
MRIPEIETKSSSEIKSLQENLLQEQLAYISKNSKYYQRAGIDFQKIKTLEDLQKIPVTTKDDLQQYNDDFICVPKNKIIDYVTTSGTLGDPVTFAMTEKDLERLAYNEAISFACAGGTENDVYQLMTTIDRRFMAGLAYFLGARKLGAGIIRVGAGVPELQWDAIRKMSPTALITVPSFILKLIDFAEKNNIDFKTSSITKAICIGEPVRNPDFTLNTLGEKIKEKWNIELFSTYASTEMATAFTECEAGRGGHHHPELIIVEFLDDNDIPVKEGEAGEVTITTLGVEGMPLLRFKTGDICFHHSEKCECGRNTLRLGPVIGRKKQMIKYKGTTLYPPALYDILNNIEQVENYVVEVFTNEIGTDEILIHLAAKEKSDALVKNISDHFRAKLRVTPTVKFVSSAEINALQNPEMSRKPVKFIDKR